MFHFEEALMTCGGFEHREMLQHGEGGGCFQGADEAILRQLFFSQLRNLRMAGTKQPNVDCR